MNILPFFMGAQSAPTIADLFATTLYTGNGATQTITNGIDLAGLGGLVWLKKRSASQGHFLIDTVRGVDKRLDTSLTFAEATNSTYLTSFNSDGFTLGAGGSNDNTATYASWSFARSPKFFDVITFTHTNGVTSNVATGLTVPLGFATVKRLDSTSDWYTNHRSLTAGYNLRLNTDAAESNTAAYVSFSGSTVVFDSAAPSGDYVVYVWGHDTGGTGVVQCGSYLASNNTNAPNINLGWPPQAILIKGAGSAGFSWLLFDTARGIPTGGNDATLIPNLANAEAAVANFLDVTATGFVGGSANSGSDLFIYLAIRAPS